MLSLGLENHIAFGSDFDGAQMSDELLDISYIPSLRAHLLEKGVREEHLDLLFYENADNFFRNI
jgi:microsomal dipeptidase-like Zn-dependent dipeptidase